MFPQTFRDGFFLFVDLGRTKLVLDTSRGNRESPSKLGIYIIEGMLQACLMGMF